MTPTQKIVAFIDGSIYAQSVCHHAAWIADRTGATVDLIHVLGPRDTSGKRDHSGEISLGARTALLQELAELDAQRSKLMSQRGRAILDDAQVILDKDGVTDISTRLRHGDVVEAVAEVEGDARVIIVGKRGEDADFAKGHLGVQPRTDRAHQHAPRVRGRARLQADCTRAGRL